jgi:hypothetical protein
VENSIYVGCVKIYVEFMNDYENFVEYMFRKLGKDIIACVTIECPGFENLKKINVMIPEIHEVGIVLAHASYYKFIELLHNYYVYYIYGQRGINNKLDKLYKESKEKINEYRGMGKNNNK